MQFQWKMLFKLFTKQNWNSENWVRDGFISYAAVQLSVFDGKDGIKIFSFEK